MTNPAALEKVAVDLATGNDDATHIGWLSRTRGSLCFEYTPSWLDCSNFITLDPALGRYPGPQFPSANRSNLGMLEDSSPDRWGRMLMQRREDLRARAQERPNRSLSAWDALLGVYDETRMGALRLRHPETGVYLDNSTEPVPPITELRALEAASWQLQTALDSGEVEALDQWLRLLIAPGSSLGGARPKCSFRMPDGALWIAKFPARNDERNVGLWEAVMMRLAKAAGITTEENELQQFGGSRTKHSSFCIRRFDREGRQRLPFVSAMNFTGKTDGDAGSYIDIVQALDDHGTFNVKKDLVQLFRRLLFNILTSNRDDHLRNHGFFVSPEGIQLSPAYDLNPMPEKHEHALAIDEKSAAPDLDAALDTASLYGLSAKEAEGLLRQVRTAVASWREVAQALDANRTEILFMGAAFRIGA